MDDLATRMDAGFERVDVDIREFKRELRDTRQEPQSEIEAGRAATDTNSGELRAEIRTTRDELKGELAGLRSELKGDIADLRGEVKADIADLRGEVKADIAALQTLTMRFGIGLVVGMIGMIATLMGVIATGALAG